MMAIDPAINKRRVSMLSDPLIDRVPEADVETPHIRPVDIKTVCLGGLFILAVLACCNIAASIIVPAILACVLKLLFQPAMRLLERCRLPRIAGAILLMIALAGVLAILGAALAVPARNWAQKLPSDLSMLQERIDTFSAPLKPIQKVLHRAEGLTGPSDQKIVPVMVKGGGLSDKVFAGTRSFASGLFEMILVLFFLLVSGDTFLRRLVEVLPRFRDKKRAIEISQQIERDIAAYLVTITFMNLVVGVATALVMIICRIGDPLLWGTIAFLLNYVPIVGPLIGVCLFALVGMMTFSDMEAALLPAVLYLGIHVTEGEGITPLLLARRFTLNPVIVILSLIFWYWMWGIAGAILVTPMLAIVKIISDRIEFLKSFGHLIEG
jgi:predicted PurR-regulated permease PerM